MGGEDGIEKGKEKVRERERSRASGDDARTRGPGILSARCDFCSYDYVVSA